MLSSAVFEALAGELFGRVHHGPIECDVEALLTGLDRAERAERDFRLRLAAERRQCFPKAPGCPGAIEIIATADAAPCGAGLAVRHPTGPAGRE